MSYITSIERLGIEEGLQQGLERGREEGRREEDLKIAKKMLAKRINPSLIKEITGLSDQDLLTLEE